MLNKNFANLVVAMLENISVSNIGGYPVPFINIQGNSITSQNSNSVTAGKIINTMFYGFNASKKFSDLTSSNSGSAFGIGSGDNADNDYDLETHIDETDFTIISSSKGRNTNKDAMLLTQVWEYTGTNTIEIKEVGLFGNVQTASSTYDTVLLDRTVLDSPITVDSEHNTFTIALTIGGKATVTVNS